MDDLYDKYADLLLKKCLNIQNEKRMIINAPMEALDFVRIVARKSYELGIEDIYFDLEDDELKHDQLKNLSIEALSKSRFWNKEIYDDYAKDHAAVLMLIAGEDDLMDDISPDLLEKTGSIYRTSRPLYRKMQAKYQLPWCIASVATERWSKKVFPNDNHSKQKLWNLIFHCALVNQENPIEAWDLKIKKMDERTKKLNSLHLKELHYQNSLGTDFTVELPFRHIWASAESNVLGKSCMVNMPTEEVFTSPKRDSANGIVYSSKPLVYNGGFIDDFCFTFEHGKIVDVKAKVGEELLRKVVTSCENADMLGEVALVDYDSAISQSGVIFYNTLFDENASCHLAIGDGFPDCYQGGEQLTKEELLKCGINQSQTHVDFMVGTKDLKITGTTWDGEEILIFHEGNFVL